MRLVTPDQIASAMREEAETGRPIAEIVVANGWVTAEDLAQIQSGAPVQAAPATPAPEPVAPAPAPVAVEPTAPAPAPPAPEPVAETPAPVVEPAPAPEPEPATEPEPEPLPPAAEAPADPAPTRTDVAARVLVRLENGERIEVGRFNGFDAAKQRAAELMREFRQSSEWPFLSGRYVRPDAIVSIDVDLTGF
jgi:outer membrane biosynthesis protein TonB